LHPATTGAVLEVVDERGARALIWPQPPDTPLPPIMTGIPLAQIRRLGLGAVRVEDVPLGALLSDLLAELDDGPRDVALMGIRAVVDGLHARGVAHGEVAPHRVWIGADGSIVLVGARVEMGSLEADLAALRVLEEGALVGSSESSASDRLRLGAAASAAVTAVAPEARQVSLLPGKLRRHADMDEVGFDLGPDEGRGLLDGWSRSGPTGELTGALTGDADRAHARLATLAAAITALDSAPDDRHSAFEGQVPDGFWDRVRGERLDPLPTPDGLPPPALASMVKGDPLSEVTAIAAHPLYPGAAPTDAGERPTQSGGGPDRTVPRITSPDLEERTQTAEVTARVLEPAPRGAVDVEPATTPASGRGLKALVVIFAALFVAALLWGLSR
jgi:hypothetical protein